MKSFYKAAIVTFFLALNIFAQIPTDSLITYYPFNGNANDASGHNLHGTTTGGVTWVSDRFGIPLSAASFDGLSGAITVDWDSVYAIPNDISVCAWVRCSSPQDGKSIVEKYYPGPDTGWILSTYNDGLALFQGRDGRGSSGTLESGPSGNISDNNWHFLVGQRIGNLWMIYLDGTLSNSSDVGGTAGKIESHSDLRIGAVYLYDSESFSNFWNGEIDDIRIYNRALDSAEIQALFHEERIVASYSFSGNANDESGYANHGVVNGATLATDRFDNTNSSYGFDGANDYIEVANDSVLNIISSYTLEAWINQTDASDDFDAIIVKRTGPHTTENYGLYTNSNGKAVFQIRHLSVNKTVESQSIVADGNWHYLAGIYNGTNLNLYIDGFLEGSMVLNDPIETNTENVQIGRIPEGGYYFNGLIDDIVIHSRALSLAEIRLHYNFYRHQILSITDVPGDQGGKSRITWSKIYLDGTGENPQITSYGVWRKIPAGGVVSKTPPSAFAIANDTLGSLYDYLGSVAAVQSDEYNFVASTLQDSSALGTNDETYLVTAHTADPNVYYISAATSGHSVNNSIPVEIADKWNMVSIPTEVPHAQKSYLFPTAISDAYSFEGNYNTSALLENGKGYWMKFDGSQEVGIPGMPLHYLEIPVNAGWNMVGSIASPMNVSSIGTNPPGLVASSFFSYDSGYNTASNLLPGKAYWVKLSAPGTLILSSTVSANASARIQIVPTNELPPPPPNDEHRISNIPDRFSLEQNYPNPFNPSTTIRFGLPAQALVKLEIYNILGQRVASLLNETKDAGYHEMQWDASNVPSGLYMYRLTANNGIESRIDMKKMVLVK